VDKPKFATVQRIRIFAPMNKVSHAIDAPLFTFQFALLCLSNFLFSASFSMMIPELPAYLTSLGGAEYKGLIIALFTLMAGISRPFSGKLTDKVGRVPVMIIGSLVCVICSLLYPVLTNVSGFLILRFFHGFSTGFKPTATSAYAADVVHESRRGEALGALSIGYTLGMSVGPILGSWLVTAYSFNTMFYISSALALGSVIILYNVKETLSNPEKFNWEHIRIRKQEIFEKTAIKPALIMLLLCFSYGCTITLAPDLSDELGIQNKGLFFAMFTITSLLVRLVANKSSDKHGRIIVLIYSVIILVISLVVLAFAHTVFTVMLGAAIFGLSWGTVGPTITAWTVDLCAFENRGRAIGSMYIALEAGIGSGAFFSAWIYQNQIALVPRAFLLSAFLAVIGLILLVIWRQKATQIRIV
jgi:multidrug resistance protein